jgi:hypothetical protein
VSKKKEPPTHDERGKFAKGNIIPRKYGLDPEVKTLREHLRAAVISTAHDELLSPASRFKETDVTKLTTLQYLIKRAVSVGNFKFIQYLLDQAIGRPITPIIAKTEGTQAPKTIIRRQDGSTIEYSLEDKKEE